jgi:amidase
MPHSPKNMIITFKEGILSKLNFVLKDMCNIKGLKTSCGNPDFHNFCEPATKNALFLDKVLNDGATLCGITVCDEFFYSVIGENNHYGTPQNLEAPNCVPGGSSSGSAAALTTNNYDFSIGSDTGGSVRVPASFCGLLGIRPTHNRINPDGVYPMAPSFDTIGWFAKDIEIFNKVGKVLLNENIKTKKIFNKFVIASDLLDLVDEDIKTQFYDYCNKKFPDIQKIKLSQFSKSDIANNFRIIQGGEIKDNFVPWINKNNPIISPEINSRIIMASNISNDEITNADLFRKSLISEINKTLPEGDIAIFPTTPFSAPHCGQSDTDLGADRKKIMEITSIAGMTSRPEISIPIFKGKTGPVGFSILGWKNSDEILLNKINDL